MSCISRTKVRQCHPIRNQTKKSSWCSKVRLQSLQTPRIEEVQSNPISLDIYYYWWINQLIGVFKTLCGAFVTVFAWTFVFIFIIARSGKLSEEGAFDFVPTDSEYSLFGNLLPELAGIIIVGGQILNWLVVPFSKISFNSKIVSRMYQGRSRS